MGEGGAVYTDDPLLNRIARSFRDWGRDCICAPGRIISADIVLTVSMENFRLGMITNMYTLILDITSRQQICRLLSDVRSSENSRLCGKKNPQL